IPTGSTVSCSPPRARPSSRPWPTTSAPLPPMIVDRIGFGAGRADRAIANLLRVFIGTAPGTGGAFAGEQTATIETTIDDMNPQIYAHLMEKALAMGALDIFMTPVQMKKNRTGTLLTILCRPEAVAGFADLLFRETTTIGLRWRLDNRFTLTREFVTVNTRFGPITCKMAILGGERVNLTPEYDDCKRAAAEHQVPLKIVLAEASVRPCPWPTNRSGSSFSDRYALTGFNSNAERAKWKNWFLKI
uniref:LarC family nickel insertion protein n=1 Tax=Desulfosarcina cetonica TaxID=90730 RepID=UPI0012ED66C8